MTENRDRANRVDVWEHRSIPIDRVELRADGNQLTLTGYASTFEPYEMYGGPAAGGWIEQLAQTAFDKTLREKPDLMLLINHEGMPLARTKSGTLKLSTDNHGLKVSAQLDRSDPDVQRLEAKMKRGDMDEMSFAFRVRNQTWSAAPGFEDEPDSLRTINEVNLQKGDVSVVNFGANPTTSAELKNAMRALVKRAEEMRADGDDDPMVLLAALDATLDEGCNLIADVDRSTLPPEVGQALDLLVAAEVTVDELMELMGVYDPDDDEGDEPRSIPARPRVWPSGAVKPQNRLDKEQLAKHQRFLSGTIEATKVLTLASQPDAPETPAKKVMSLHEALARQGLAADDGSTLSLREALDQIGEHEDLDPQDDDIVA